MAKTFKNIARPEPVVQKRVSERDFFDLTDEPALPTPLLSSGAPLSNISNTGVTGNKRNKGNKGNSGSTLNTDNTIDTTDNISIPDNGNNTSNNDNPGNINNTDNNSNNVVPEVVGSIAPAAAPGDVRQTFVLSRGHLEQLRDYVHARRAQGEYTYSQKQALQEALTMLFADAAPAQPRPVQVREREQQHRQRIQQGRHASSSE